MIINKYIHFSNFYKLLIFLFVIFIININYSYSQVNTEKYRDFKKTGFYHNFNLGVDISKGNEDYAEFETKYRLEYVNPNFQTFLVFDMAYKKGNEELITNEGFLHYRFIYNTQEFFEPEVFTQYEIDDFILIKKRMLAGAGIRLNAINNIVDSAERFNFDIGIGLMYEEEHVSDSYQTITKFLRSTNYLSFRYRITDNLDLVSVTYVQPHLKNFNDFRVYSENLLTVKITKMLAIYFTTRYRYDNEPPENLKYYDFDLINGLSLSF